MASSVFRDGFNALSGIIRWRVHDRLKHHGLPYVQTERAAMWPLVIIDDDHRDLLRRNDVVAWSEGEGKVTLEVPTDPDLTELKRSGEAATHGAELSVKHGRASMTIGVIATIGQRMNFNGISR